MTFSASIFKTKTNLSELIKQVQMGETVVITSGRNKVPVAKLEANFPVKNKRIGAMETPGFLLTQAFFEPLPEEALAMWDGHGE
jgi:antitoxin (DNA-binding transcriptional repressor) of toxin-antitoxin stability system